MHTVKQAAAKLDCSAAFVYRLIRDRLVTHERRGRKILLSDQALEEYKQRTQVQATTAPPAPPKPSGFRHLFQGR